MVNYYTGNYGRSLLVDDTRSSTQGVNLAQGINQKNNDGSLVPLICYTVGAHYPPL
jgi:hypothetical protein